MPKRSTRAVIFALLVLAASGTWAEERRATRRIGGVHWHEDLYAAHLESVRQQRPMLIVFGASWCGYCRKLEQQTLSHRNVAQAVRAGYIPVHLDLDNDAHIARILEVKAVPCTVILSPRADLLGRQAGYVDAEKFQGLLQSAHRSARPRR